MTSNEIAIRVAGLSKCYQIYDAPRDRLKQFLWPRLRRLFRLAPKKYFKEFWAVRDVSFEIGRGETVGIIGRNGSGKSTLLQIICGTLTPSSGRVDSYGRVAALLELGSGFNPECTGRENVYLNGVVLGLSREQISSRLNKILMFADIGDFIDQPVKTYSSGMVVRLAFAVIAHVDPEILVIDEALSVGDAFFQSKCASAMRALINSGTTILFVSHDTQAVKALCDKAILLENGSIAAHGDAGSVVEEYYSRLVGAAADGVKPLSVTASGVGVAGDLTDDSIGFQTRAAFQRIQNGKLRFLDIRLLDNEGNDISVVEFKQKVTLRMVVEALAHIPLLGMAYHIRDMKGVELVYSDTGVEGDVHLADLAPGQRCLVDWTFRASLQEGDYNFSSMASIPVDLAIGDVEVCDFVPFALQFRVVRGPSLPIYAAVHWDNVVTKMKLK